MSHDEYFKKVTVGFLNTLFTLLEMCLVNCRRGTLWSNRSKMLVLPLFLVISFTWVRVEACWVFFLTCTVSGREINWYVTKNPVGCLLSDSLLLELSFERESHVRDLRTRMTKILYSLFTFCISINYHSVFLNKNNRTSMF